MGSLPYTADHTANPMEPKTEPSMTPDLRTAVLTLVLIQEKNMKIALKQGNHMDPQQSRTSS